MSHNHNKVDCLKDEYDVLTDKMSHNHNNVDCLKDEYDVLTDKILPKVILIKKNIKTLNYILSNDMYLNKEQKSGISNFNVKLISFIDKFTDYFYSRKDFLIKKLEVEEDVNNTSISSSISSSSSDLLLKESDTMIDDFDKIYSAISKHYLVSRE